jgi:hypothetical protein
LPLSPSPWSQITVAACVLLAGTTIYVCVYVCVCVCVCVCVKYLIIVQNR